MSDKIWQEFYCGECNGYIRIKLNMQLNCEIEFVCPGKSGKCGHKHRRVIRDGIIRENGRFANEPKFELVPTQSAYSKEPWTSQMKKAAEKNHHSGRREGVPITKESPRDAFSEQQFRDRWFELYGGN